MQTISSQELLSLVRYAIKNKFPFILTYYLVKMHNVGMLLFKDSLALDIIESLTILTSNFREEVLSLVEIVEASGGLFMKLPLIPLDLTTDLDVIFLDGLNRIHNIHQIDKVTRVFKLKVDVYTKERLCREYKVCHLNDDCLTRRVLKLVYFEGREPKVDKIKVMGLDIGIDAYIMFRNVLTNGFITYYDYINLVSLMRYLSGMPRFYNGLEKDRPMKEQLAIMMVPNLLRYKYPALILHKDISTNVMIRNLVKFIKSLIIYNYTPVYGDLIQYFRGVTNRLGKGELSRLL